MAEVVLVAVGLPVVVAALVLVALLLVRWWLRGDRDRWRPVRAAHAVQQRVGFSPEPLVTVLLASVLAVASTVALALGGADGGVVAAAATASLVPMHLRFVQRVGLRGVRRVVVGLAGTVVVAATIGWALLCAGRVAEGVPVAAAAPMLLGGAGLGAVLLLAVQTAGCAGARSSRDRHRLDTGAVGSALRPPAR